MNTTTITDAHNKAANQIKEIIKEQLLESVVINGEWVANLGRDYDSKDYHFFIKLSNISGLKNDYVINYNGVLIDDIFNVEANANSIIDNIKKRGLLNYTIFKS